MTDVKLYLRDAIAPGASDIVYSSRADGSADGKVAHTALATVYAGLLAGTFAAASHTHTVSEITDIAAVGASNDYNDLDNLPSLFSGAYGDLTGAPSLAAVATSGAYSDLSGTPTLGTVAALDVDTDTTLAADSDAKIPSQKAVKAYVLANAGGGGLSDGDKGDITVGGSGTTLTIDNDVVTYAKMQNASAGNVVLTRANSASGDYGETALSASNLLGRGSTGDIAAITMGAGVQMSGAALKGADYYVHRLVGSTGNGTDLAYGFSTSYALVGNWFFSIDLDTFMPTHFRIVVILGVATAGTITLQLTTSASASAVLHTGGDDLAIPNTGGAITRDSGWRTFDNTAPLSGFQTLAISGKSSSGTPNLTHRSIEIHFKR